MSIEGIDAGMAATGLRRAVRHALTLMRRNLLQLVRAPGLIVVTAVQPIIFVLLFNYVFGGAIIPGGGCIDFLVPGIVVMFVAVAAVGTGIGLNADVAQDINDRFRSLPIDRSAVLTGRILAETVRIVSHIVVITGVGALIGFRISAGLISALVRLCWRSRSVWRWRGSAPGSGWSFGIPRRSRRPGSCGCFR